MAWCCLDKEIDVDHKIGVNLLVEAVFTGHADAHAPDSAVSVALQPTGPNAVEDSHVAPSPHPLANTEFEQHTAHGQEDKLALVLNAPAAGVVPAELATNIDGNRSRCTEVLRQPWK